MISNAYIVFEATTGYYDGYYIGLAEATAQCNDLKRDFPMGVFMVFKLEYKAQENTRLTWCGLDRYTCLSKGLTDRGVDL